MAERRGQVQLEHFHDLGTHLLISLNMAIEHALGNGGVPQEYAGCTAAAYIAAAVRNPEWALAVAIMLDEIAPDSTDLFTYIVKRMPVHGFDMAAPRLTGGFEWMHGLGFGDLDGQEEADGEGQAAVRRAQPEASATFDADYPEPGASAENQAGKFAADEGGDVA